MHDLYNNLPSTMNSMPTIDLQQTINLIKFLKKNNIRVVEA